MAELTYEQKYANTKAECQACVAVIQPWLMEFRAQYNEEHQDNDIGSCIYDNGQEDKIRITTSPFGNYWWSTKQGQELLEQQRAGDIGLYYIYGGDAAFIIEYAAPKPVIVAYEGQMLQTIKRKPSSAYFLHANPYSGKITRVDGRTKAEADRLLNTALAAQKLCSESEYLGALYGCILEKKKRNW